MQRRQYSYSRIKRVHVFQFYLDEPLRTTVFTFSLKFLFAAARERQDVAALLTRWLSSSCKIPSSRKVCGRGWSLFSRFPFNFLRVFSRPGHCSSSISITASERTQLQQLTNEDIITRRQTLLHWFSFGHKQLFTWRRRKPSTAGSKSGRLPLWPSCLLSLSLFHFLLCQDSDEQSRKYDFTIEFTGCRKALGLWGPRCMEHTPQCKRMSAPSDTGTSPKKRKTPSSKILLNFSEGSGGTGER